MPFSMCKFEMWVFVNIRIAWKLFFFRNLPVKLVFSAWCKQFMMLIFLPFKRLSIFFCKLQITIHKYCIIRRVSLKEWKWTEVKFRQRIHLLNILILFLFLESWFLIFISCTVHVCCAMGAKIYPVVSHSMKKWKWVVFNYTNL